MEAGFVPDRMFHEDAVERTVWQAGETEQAYELGMVPMGIKFDRKGAMPVTTYRCPDCGELRSFALPAAQTR